MRDFMLTCNRHGDVALFASNQSTMTQATCFVQTGSSPCGLSLGVRDCGAYDPNNYEPLQPPSYPDS